VISITVNQPLTVDEINWEQTPAPGAHVSGEEFDVIVDVLLDAQAYRVVAQQAIHQLHVEQVRYRDLETKYHGALDELRSLRGEQQAGV
jgi:hypothetical protein